MPDDASALVAVAFVAALSGAVWRARHPAARAAPVAPTGRPAARAAPVRGIAGRIARGAALGALRAFARILSGR